jgi:hypothetical protein
MIQGVNNKILFAYNVKDCNLNLDILSLIQEEQLVGETGGTAPLPCLPY